MQVTDPATTPPNWELYRRTVVDIRFPDRTVRVRPRPRGTADGLFPELPEPAGTAALHVVTACDAHGRPALDEDNARAQALLLDDLDRRGLAWWPAAGGDAHGTHIEQSAAVAGLSDSAARELGRCFGQDAVFAWTPGAWRLLSCDGGATDVQGWIAFTNRGGSWSSVTWPPASRTRDRPPKPANTHAETTGPGPGTGTTMGMHPMRTPDRCPRCGRVLSGPPVERVRADGFPAKVTYETDPVCGARWHVWDKTSPLRHLARPHVDGK